MRTIHAADLFCGAGGTSTGLYAAADDLGYRVNLLAVNHWNMAIATHSANHTEAVHLCETLDNVNPRKLFPGGRLDLLVASPECTHHSNARGGRPMNDQSRASAWHICRWAEAIYIKNIIIENVKEFMHWGPLGATGKPIKGQMGETFQAFLNSLRALGYNVDHAVLNAANYGDPTTRERLFIIARRRAQIRWPKPSHTPKGGNAFGWKTKAWRPAREIIDWSIVGQSIFQRKRPLSPNTVARILAGLKKFGGPELQPFLVMMYGTNDARSVERPMPTITGGGNHIGVAQPFLVGAGGPSGAGRPKSTENPLNTVMTENHKALVQPFLVPFFGERNGQKPRTHSVGDPLPAVTSHGAGALVEPFLVEYHGGPGQEKRVRSVDEPLPTVVAGGKSFGLAEPVIVPTNHGKDDKRSHSVDAPMPTVTSVDAWGLADAVLVNAGGPKVAPRSVDDPLNTVLTRDHMGVAGAHIMKYNGTGGPRSVDEPLDTIRTRDAFGLVQPVINGMALDIRFRMLQPHELARAMSFPDSYQFRGTREERVKQIGNAVPVGLAKALCKAVLEDQ